MTKTANECPFCGFNSTQILGPKTEPQTSAHGRGYQVECINCASRGPCGMESRMEAIKAWNSREQLDIIGSTIQM